MYKWLYNIFLTVYPKLIAIAALNNKKAKLWLEGRREAFSLLEQKLLNNTNKTIWMHCASLGEFEQGRPLLEAIKNLHPEYKIILSFFSPSGYEVRKNYPLADLVCYLPMDGKTNAIRFYDIVNPSLVIFVKYEFWFYYLKEAKKRNIPSILVSAIFRPNQLFFKWYGKLYREMLVSFEKIFVQNESSKHLLESIRINSNVFISGDPRFDRVIEIANNSLIINNIDLFIKNKKIIVAGSTWTEDDKVLSELAKLETEYNYIIAPHDITENRLNECLTLYPDAQLFSEWRTNPKNDLRVIIIDNIGMLSYLYKYAYICFIGGGWGKAGIHNLLEAAVYNKPVVFGPIFHQFEEANAIIEEGGGFYVDNLSGLKKISYNLLNDADFYAETSQKAGDFVRKHAGATNKIIKKIECFLN